MQQCVLVDGMDEGIVAELGDIEPALCGPVVEGLDIFHYVVERDAVGIDEAIDHGIEDKGVVGAGAKAEGEFHLANLTAKTRRRKGFFCVGMSVNRKDAEVQRFLKISGLRFGRGFTSNMSAGIL